MCGRGWGVRPGLPTEDKSAAEDERKQVLSLVPLKDWGTLPLERYALGQAAPAGSGPTYRRLIEFGTPRLGSIKGGSAAKHIMYQHVCGEWRLAAPLRGMDPRDAWTDLRGRFMQAFDAVDDLELLRFGPSWFDSHGRAVNQRTSCRRSRVSRPEVSRAIAHAVAAARESPTECAVCRSAR